MTLRNDLARDNLMEIQEEPIETRVGHSNDSHFPSVCTHELFEKQVVASPDAVALVCGESRASYRELNDRANKLARRLRKLGVGPDVLVGVLLERTPEMVVALLAVWKAGGAYVPLDTAYPGARVEFMINDSQPLAVITEHKWQDRLGAVAEKAVYLDSEWPLIEQESGENLALAAKAGDLAYVIYTSGSTGKPKGAMIVHRGLVNYLWWAIDAYGVKPGCLVPVHTSLSFDLTVTSLYPPLLVGGTVELLPNDSGAQALLSALESGGNRGLVKITPAHLALLSHEIDPALASDAVGVFVIGGENLLAESLELWRALPRQPRLFNEYGPTETVVGCCVYEVKPDDPRTGSIPIGWPIANTHLYILDADLKPLPDGQIGELYIGGAGVGRGYLNRPELTAERFLVDPFGGDPDGRLYRTGDLARRRDDGMLEYLGRIDDQVKIRGFRIELGEVEAGLAAQPLVKSCAVLAREDGSGSKQLVAYVVPMNDETLDVMELRRMLRKELPEHMVPARFVVMEDLPLTPNGKLDRKALPAPSRRTNRHSGGRQATSPTEKAIEAIWSEVLGVEGLGIDESFFDLGDSLNAVEMVEQIEAEFDIQFNLATFFELATIAELAKFIDATLLGRPVAEELTGGAKEEFEL